MEANRTLFEDVLADEYSVPSTSTFTLNDTPHTHDLINHMKSIWNKSAWVVYTVAGFATIAVILIACFIALWIVKHKKTFRRVIQQDNDPILANAYDGGLNWKSCCVCCVPKQEKITELRNRQNSASNLDPYKRPQIPPFIRRKDEYPYINVFNRSDVLDGLKKHEALDDKALAVNIQSIRGIPHVNIQPEQYRNLPPLEMRHGYSLGDHILSSVIQKAMRYVHRR
ncbi:hypothetical protein DICVIV_07952 [Dictyocaulus viviparus]|uniref:Uncharacterized protein n=1 Tax=Dictyocaulus viviparus TaxID=29172 RepID=A0A0D8XQC0_DICVI|nr:hypothetical protein DICVIV_07952 [Dictyocaulus viviparus]